MDNACTTTGKKDPDYGFPWERTRSTDHKLSHLYMAILLVGTGKNNNKKPTENQRITNFTSSNCGMFPT
jgi:hypothetical protein